MGLGPLKLLHTALVHVLQGGETKMTSQSRLAICWKMVCWLAFLDMSWFLLRRMSSSKKRRRSTWHFVKPHLVEEVLDGGLAGLACEDVKHMQTGRRRK